MFSITFDEYGVPTVRADDMQSLYFAIGYLHGRDRTVQVEMSRLVALGRLSEFGGAEFLDSDIFQRALRIGEVSRNTYQLLDQEQKESLKAYSEGVNAGYDSLKVAPPEFRLAHYLPKEFRPEDAIGVGKLMSFMVIDDYELELLRSRLEPLLGREMVDDLFTSPLRSAVSTLKMGEFDGTELLKKVARMGSYRIRAGRVLEERLPVPRVSDPPSWTAKIPPLGSDIQPARDGEKSTGSNAFVLSGSRTSTGLPILANDPHLGLSLPSVWYEVRVHLGKREIVGFTMPGALGILIGADAFHAWGFTAMGADVTDATLFKLNEGSPKVYLTEEGKKAFQSREEKYRVRGIPFSRTVVRPLYSAPDGTTIFQSEDGQAYGIRWTGMETDGEVVAFSRLAFTNSLKEFEEAIREITTPLNILYADRDGNIAYFAAGKIPVRNYDGRHIRDGSKSGLGWLGYLTTEDLPRGVNPRRGFFASANNQVAPEDDLEAILSGFRTEGYRAQRIEQMIENTDVPLSLFETLCFQTDLLSLEAETLLPTLFEKIKRDGLEPTERGALELLQDWDFRMGRGSSSAAIYLMFRRELIKGIFGDELEEVPGREAFMRVIRGGSPFDWFDDIETEEVETTEVIITRSFKNAVSELERILGPDPSLWTLGSLSLLRLRNPIMPDYYHSDLLPRGGSGDTVNVTHSTFRGDRFLQYAGPSMRMVVSFEDGGTRIFTVIPGGQGGDPQKAHYLDQLKIWNDCSYRNHFIPLLEGLE